MSKSLCSHACFSSSLSSLKFQLSLLPPLWSSCLQSSLLELRLLHTMLTKTNKIQIQKPLMIYSLPCCSWNSWSKLFTQSLHTAANLSVVWLPGWSFPFLCAVLNSGLEWATLQQKSSGFIRLFVWSRKTCSVLWYLHGKTNMAVLLSLVLRWLIHRGLWYFSN